jgi:MerR family copper efflux transcriptional regulator
MESGGGTAKDRLTIGKVARVAGVTVETIRYYEREGLMVQPPRPDGHSRVYPEDAISRLRFIRRAKELGFSLTEIRDLLQLGTHPETACHLVRARAEEKMADIDSKLASLTKIREALGALTAACREAPDGSCPFLEALERET